MTPEPKTKATEWRNGTLVYTRSSLSMLFFWLLWGDFAIALRGGAIHPAIKLYLKKYDASDTLIAILVSTLPLVIGFVLGPILSMLSDRHRGPRGRRIPFLMIGAPLATLMPICFVSSPFLGQALNHLLGAASPGLAACILIVFSVFLLIFDLANGYTGIGFNGLLNDVVPHAVIGRFGSMFRMVGLAAGVLFSYFLMGSVETHSSWVFIGTSVLYGIGMWTICFKVREGEYPPPPPKPRNPWAGAVTYCKESFTNPYYLLLFTALTLAGLAFVPVNSFSVFLAKSAGISVADYGKIIAVTHTLSFLLAYPIGKCADRFHPLPLGILSMGTYALTALWGGLFATTATRVIVVFSLHQIVTGCYASAMMSINQRLLPKDKYVQYHTANGIFGTPLWMAIGPVVGMLLDWSGHAYHLTFLMGGVLASLATVFMVLLFRRFNRLGGVRGYKAPE